MTQSTWKEEKTGNMFILVFNVVSTFREADILEGDQKVNLFWDRNIRMSKS